MDRLEYMKDRPVERKAQVEMRNWMDRQEYTKDRPVGRMKRTRWVRNLMTHQGLGKLKTERCTEHFQAEGGIPPVKRLA